MTVACYAQDRYVFICYLQTKDNQPQHKHFSVRLLETRIILPEPWGLP